MRKRLSVIIPISLMLTLAILSAVCGMRTYGDIKKNTCSRLGCIPRDVAADGMICSYGSNYYIANKPTNGCITKIDKNGREIIIYRNSRLNDTGYIAKINIWDGWIYFAVMNEELGEDSVTRYGEFRRLKIGSRRDEKIDGIDLFYEDGSGNAVIAKGKLYYTSAESEEDYKNQLIECNLDGTDKKVLSKDTGWGKFAIDEDGIYYNERCGKGFRDYNIVKRAYGNTGKPEILTKCSYSTILYSDGKLYYATDKDNVHLGNVLCSFDIKTGIIEQIKSVPGNVLWIDALTDDGRNIVAALYMSNMEDKEKFVFIDRTSKVKTKLITKNLDREALKVEGQPSIYDVFVLGKSLYYHCNFEQDDEFYDNGPEKPLFETISID